jgi:FMN hydrolase / 5-amino-6-(5-phospho-D-ribitylamino)uracil phosphatase
MMRAFANKIRAVAFDLDNTLWDVDPVIVRAEQQWLAWLRENCPRIAERHTLEDFRAARLELAALEPHNAHDFTYLRINALARQARACGYDESIAEAAFEVFITARNQIDLFPDVLPGLHRLRARYRLASLSNGNADLVRIGVGEHFDVSLNSRSIGAAKPARLCFERLVQDLQLQPHEVIYVGDDPLLDVEASHTAGLSSAWMNRTNQAWPPTVTPADIQVADCIELAIQLDA